MLNEEQRFGLWRSAMTDPVLAAEGFSLTKQDLRRTIDELDDANERGEDTTADESLVKIAEKVPDPVYDAKLYPELPVDATAKERARAPKPPERVVDALSSEQLKRLSELVSLARQDADAEVRIRG